MAADKKTMTYPKISRKVWWLLRARFLKSIPSLLTPTIIDSVSPMNESSARSNVIAPLRELGLVDADNKPTELAQRWRHDDDYAAVCHEIRKNVYPLDLVEAFPDPGPENKESIKNWFMKKGQVGDAAARMYADTYILLSQANISSVEVSPSVTSQRSANKPIKSSTSRKTDPKTKAAIESPIHQESPQDHVRSKPKLPAIHIDVQVHISPETSAEQIDRIFESMAKHLGSFTN